MNTYVCRTFRSQITCETSQEPLGHREKSDPQENRAPHCWHPGLLSRHTVSLTPHADIPRTIEDISVDS